MKRIEKIWFEGDYIYGLGDDSQVYKQSLLWYDRLRAATDEERNKYEFGLTGIHWRDLDEDISFESFTYEEAIPSPLQEFFLTHKEINVGEFAKSMGLNPTLLRNYIRGWKKPSETRENEILDHIHAIGCNYAMQTFSSGVLSESELPQYGSKKSKDYEQGFQDGVKSEHDRMLKILKESGISEDF